MQKLIFNSDDFGLTLEGNLAIMEGHLNGVLTSTCIAANGEYYRHGIDEIMPQIPNIGRGIHLNAIEGKSLTKPSLLVDCNGVFNKSFQYYFFNSKNKKLLDELEKEFRAQIEKILSDTEVDHINSHVHIHAIPSIFNLVLKLALEYKIKNVRLQFEEPYLVVQKMFDLKFPVNLVKLALLHTLSIANRNTIDRLNSKSDNKRIDYNNYLVGVTYTGYMDENSILAGLKRVCGKENKTVEVIVHPKSLSGKKNTPNYKEFSAVLNPVLKEKIEKLGYTLTNFKNLQTDEKLGTQDGRVEQVNCR